MHVVDVRPARMVGTILRNKKNLVHQLQTKKYQFKDLITCSTVGVVYMLECECGLQYIGRTSRALHVRVGEHSINIKKGLKTHSVSRHFRMCHHRDPKGLKFWGIKKVSTLERG